MLLGLAITSGSAHPRMHRYICDTDLLFGAYSIETPLHKAARNGRVEVVQLLLSCNAAVDARAREYALLIFSCIVPLTFAPDSLLL